MNVELWLSEFRDPDSVFRASAMLLGVGQVVTTLEYLWIRSEFGDGGVYAWSVLRFARPRRHPTMEKLRDTLFGRAGMVALLGLRLLLAVTLVLFASVTWLATIAVVALAAVLLAFNVRVPWGMDGADNVFVHVTLGLAAYALARLFDAPSVGLYYIAAYAGLAYVTSGVTKLSDAAWRSGVALGWVVNLQVFGARWAVEFLAPRPRLRQVLSWSVMLGEVSAPLAVLLPAHGIALVLVAGLAFHATMAVCMGLNTFVWAFLATYPAVLLVWTTVHNLAIHPLAEP
jgi:hypothetical protein